MKSKLIGESIGFISKLVDLGVIKPHTMLKIEKMGDGYGIAIQIPIDGNEPFNLISKLGQPDKCIGHIENGKIKGRNLKYIEVDLLIPPKYFYE